MAVQVCFSVFLRVCLFCQKLPDLIANISDDLNVLNNLNLLPTDKCKIVVQGGRSWKQRCSHNGRATRCWRWHWWWHCDLKPVSSFTEISFYKDVILHRCTEVFTWVLYFVFYFVFYHFEFLLSWNLESGTKRPFQENEEDEAIVMLVATYWNVRAYLLWRVVRNVNNYGGSGVLFRFLASLPVMFARCVMRVVSRCCQPRWHPGAHFIYDSKC